MKHVTIAAALSLPLLAACGSTAATHATSPKATPAAAAATAQCSRLSAAVKTIRSDTTGVMPGNPRMLAIVATGKAAGWSRSLKHAAAAPGPARDDIILAESAADFLKLQAALAEAGAGTGQPVVKPWDEMNRDLKQAAVKCGR